MNFIKIYFLQYFLLKFFLPAPIGSNLPLKNLLSQKIIGAKFFILEVLFKTPHLSILLLTVKALIVELFSLVYQVKHFRYRCQAVIFHFHSMFQGLSIILNFFWNLKINCLRAHLGAHVWILHFAQFDVFIHFFPGFISNKGILFDYFKVFTFLRVDRKLSLYPFVTL